MATSSADIMELHYIAPIANVISILEHGILSHNLVERIVHHSVAMPEIQERRGNKQIPGARPLHDYANLYFDAHNPMLSKCRDRNDEICVLRVAPAALYLPGVIIADRNAASDWVRFYSAKDGLKNINPDRLFARYWTHPDNLLDEMRHKSEKCAEVLVPDRVEPGLLRGAYVANSVALSKFQQLTSELSVQIRSDIFF